MDEEKYVNSFSEEYGRYGEGRVQFSWMNDEVDPDN
jgi:hypothetical protein